MKILRIDHVQLAMPQDQEERAREFYVDLLGLTEVRKPAELLGRGGAWFADGSVHVPIASRVFQLPPTQLQGQSTNTR